MEILPSTNVQSFVQIAFAINTLTCLYSYTREIAINRIRIEIEEKASPIQALALQYENMDGNKNLAEACRRCVKKISSIKEKCENAFQTASKVAKWTGAFFALLCILAIVLNTDSMKWINIFLISPYPLYIITLLIIWLWGNNRSNKHKKKMEGVIKTINAYILPPSSKDESKLIDEFIKQNTQKK